MSTKNMAARTGEFILSEANGSRSREVVTVAGGPYPPGEVLGVITDSGKYKKHDPSKTDGLEKAVSILFAGKSSSTDDELVVIMRDAEVDDKSINWGDLSEANKITAIGSLAESGIIAR